MSARTQNTAVIVEPGVEQPADLTYEHGEKLKNAGKFPVPPEREERQRMIRVVADYVAGRQLVPPLLFEELAEHADAVLHREKFARKYREFLIVLVNNAVWMPVVAGIPFERRTLLLPPCVRDSGRCHAEFDELGLLCERCGACEIAELSEMAEDLGYTVLVAEGTSVVAKLVEEGKIDAVIGVSCMPALERTFPHVASNAVPGLAIPLLRDGCRDTDADVDWIREAIRLKSSAGWTDRMDLNRLHTEIRTWFDEKNLRVLLRTDDTITERIALEWLAGPGKRWRPFLAACVCQALLKCPSNRLPDAARKVAIAVECIHKASLIYDDIQDNDDTRYGEKTVHAKYGVPAALTSSLLLLGYGYRLIAECGLPPADTERMMFLATDGHCRLCQGQGDELWWTRNPTPLTVPQVLDIFRRKTAPSFEVVFGLGAICGKADEATQSALRAYSEAIGVAYQIQDDLQDFTETGDVDDIKSRRPSIMLALAYDHATKSEKKTVGAVWTGGVDTAGANEIRKIIARHGVERKARELLDQYRSGAFRSLASLRNPDLKTVLYRVTIKILKGT